MPQDERAVLNIKVMCQCKYLEVRRPGAVSYARSVMNARQPRYSEKLQHQDSPGWQGVVCNSPSGRSEGSGTARRLEGGRLKPFMHKPAVDGRTLRHFWLASLRRARDCKKVSWRAHWFAGLY
ncbi:hypothetical protein M404DRAFT_1001919 [Pisolithus tinctorius Marx 270]|uniref:Uncharacterized protein n=1 Tax=Pisolithus tinctorius Marx 270 TaxID=870435 RepID=A0A0C3J0U8_PISTI|nr:hypothetical protein M404DRAFT_1001919 [Pisolithus tinctorius Marx 270]